MQTIKAHYMVQSKLHIAHICRATSGENKVPTIIMFPDFAGITERAITFANKWCLFLGANIIIADMYGNGLATSTPEESGECMNKVLDNPSYYRELCLAPLELIQQLDNADLTQIYTLGYCFGGQSSLNLGKYSDKIKGIISVHGLLKSNVKFEHQNNPKILVLHGAKDPLVSAEDLNIFEKEMLERNTDVMFVSFYTSTHAFTNYNAIGDKSNQVVSYDFLSDQRSNKLIQNFITE